MAKAKPKNHKGRPDKYRTAALQRKVLEAYGVTFDVQAAVRMADTTRTTHYRWLQTDEEYRRKFEAVQRGMGFRLEEEAFRRAVNGVNKSVFYRGIECGVETVYSDAILQKMLAARMPEVYRDKQELTCKDEELDKDIAELVRKYAELSQNGAKGAAAPEGGTTGTGGAIPPPQTLADAAIISELPRKRSAVRRGGGRGKKRRDPNGGTGARE